MRTFKRMLGVTGLTGLLAAIAGAAPAMADNSGNAACTVSGQALTNPAVQLTGGSGSYTFNSANGASGLQLNCAVRVDGPEGNGVVTASATSIGTYTNTVCGTGTASSLAGTAGNNITSAVSQGVPNPSLEAWTKAQSDDLEYDITFTGTAGALTFGSATNAGNASGRGPIQITDPTPGNTAPFEANHGANDCTTDFQVSGALQGSVPAE
jgi:hypothetical protein